MKYIVLTLALSFTALAQQPPAKLFIKAPQPAPRTTGAIMKRCPKAVTVTNQSDNAQYMLDLTGVVKPKFLGVHISYAATLFNQAGDSVATFETKTPEQLGEQACQYIESHPSTERK